ncbi:hypothetical protein QBC34DRAFT_7515 [Podospora aff. communis PSN243]|uniref:Uncharacterized protein n=1 Tax=Podospora aff. communis PSN243 TaxID=3040156 RepID=A0AAV9H4N5_9PEZI|nr:hypothetical protein QBC34DRAFT_7515 [Podospora aff. communis PSN243]
MGPVRQHTAEISPPERPRRSNGGHDCKTSAYDFMMEVENRSTTCTQSHQPRRHLPRHSVVLNKQPGFCSHHSAITKSTKVSSPANQTNSLAVARATQTTASLCPTGQPSSKQFSLQHPDVPAPGPHSHSHKYNHNAPPAMPPETNPRANLLRLTRQPPTTNHASDATTRIGKVQNTKSKHHESTTRQSARECLRTDLEPTYLMHPKDISRAGIGP